MSGSPAPCSGFSTTTSDPGDRRSSNKSKRFDEASDDPLGVDPKRELHKIKTKLQKLGATIEVVEAMSEPGANAVLIRLHEQQRNLLLRQVELLTQEVEAPSTTTSGRSLLERPLPPLQRAHGPKVATQKYAIPDLPMMLVWRCMHEVQDWVHSLPDFPVHNPGSVDNEGTLVCSDSAVESLAQVQLFAPVNLALMGLRQAGLLHASAIWVQEPRKQPESVSRSAAASPLPSPSPTSASPPAASLSTNLGATTASPPPLPPTASAAPAACAASGASGAPGAAGSDSGPAQSISSNPSYSLGLPLQFEEPVAQLMRMSWGDDVEAAQLLSFVELKHGSILDPARTMSLATCYNNEMVQPSNARPNLLSLRSVLGQVCAYARSTGASYFAVSTYEVLWLCCLDAGGRLHISRGLAHDEKQPTARQALTWLSVKAMTESLRRRKMRAVGSTAACGAPGVPPAPAGSSGDGSSEGLEAAHGSSSGVASNTSGDGRLEVFVDPGEELGSGIHGIVWAGMVGSAPAAIKASHDADNKEEQEGIAREAALYRGPLQSLQGSRVPCLLGAGFSSDNHAYIILSRIWGRCMEATDEALLPQAMEALRAVHSVGVLHGDIRLENFLVEESPAAGAPRVVIIDFARAREGASVQEFEQEEEQLRGLF